MQVPDVIYDWNKLECDATNIKPKIELCDETLRDGLQSPSVEDPPVEIKKQMLQLMDDLGIFIANIGLPGAGPRAVADTTELAKYIRDQKLNIKANCAARTLAVDIEPIAKIQDLIGLPIEAYCFLGASPIRQLVEDWDIDKLLRTTEEAILFAQKQNLEVAFVTEDTSRSHPDTLTKLFNHVIKLGCKRLVLCDTAGHATPRGAERLVNWTKALIKQSNEPVKIDWHGHNDRGLGVINALAAAKAGADRIHGTALGIGERVGNAAIDQLIINLKLMDSYEHDVSKLVDYVELAAKACGIDIPVNYPLCGKDAFRTATGVHAAAVIKAEAKGDFLLADLVYSGVPAHWFGKKQSIEIGPMSGISNIRYWLKKRGFTANDEKIHNILNHAKRSSRVLSEIELVNLVNN
ncbi:MAG: 2-isopropylmalate synthase [bacterium]|nr:2-isopropylmalate synthase [bacterium]